MASADRSRAWFAASLIGLALAMAACGDRTACPVQCGGACVLANVCQSLSCPAGSPCDPCSGQCRPQCGADVACGDPSQACCPGGCFTLASSSSNCGVCGRVCDASTTMGCAQGACTCRPGFAPSSTDPTRCVEIDECLSANGGCPSGSTCQNRSGSYSCPCDPGYVSYAGGCARVPVLTLSDSFGGVPRTELPAGQSMYGRLYYLASNNAQACLEVLGTSDGNCSNLANWTTFPNPDWSFDVGSGEWRSSYGPNAFAPSMYRIFCRNSITGVAMTPWVMTLR